jgi:hypothetical protein
MGPNPVQGAVPGGVMPVHGVLHNLPKKSPKDWSPARPPVLLTKKDRLHLAYILSGEVVDKKDVEWLCKKVDMLARLGPEEFEFPSYAALVNPIACTAFAMRFSRGRHWRRETTLEAGPLDGTVTLMDMTTQSPVCDADMVVRPFVRLASTTKPEMVDEIRREKLEMEVDGETVISGSLDDHLVRPDGWSVRRIPYMIHRVGACLFTAVALDEQSQASAEQQYGLMAPNGTKINIRLVGCENSLSERVRLTTGVVAAAYTTKAL